MKPPRPKEKGEAQEQTENRPQDNVSSAKQLPHGVEGSSPAPEVKRRPVQMGDAAEEARFELQKAYLILRGVGNILPFRSDVGRGDLARFAAAVDFIGQFTKRIESTPPALTAFDRVHGQGAGDRFGGTLAGFDPADQIPIEL